MGFFSKMVSATIKTALTPVAIVKDVVNVTLNKDANATKELLDSSKDDVVDAADDLTEGNL